MNNYDFVITDEMQKEIEDAIFTKTQELEYPDLVEILVRQKYSQSKVEAILNNYLYDPSSIEHSQEFSNLQDYRIACKLKARELLEMN